MTDGVLQSWVVERCSLKEQTVLLCALRGADSNGSNELKSWTRKIRRTVLRNAAPKKTFMQHEVVLNFRQIADCWPRYLDMLPVHYLSHLMHACQVIGCRHPVQPTAILFNQAYLDLCEYLHVNPETPNQMTNRLRDEIEYEDLDPKTNIKEENIGLDVESYTNEEEEV